MEIGISITTEIDKIGSHAYTTIDCLEDSSVGASAQYVTPVEPSFGWSILEQLIPLGRGQNQCILLILNLQQRPTFKLKAII